MGLSAFPPERNSVAAGAQNCGEPRRGRFDIREKNIESTMASRKTPRVRNAE
jgi:hypothetical protein